MNSGNFGAIGTGAGNGFGAQALTKTSVARRSVEGVAHLRSPRRW
jgi:hypothetical protein